MLLTLANCVLRRVAALTTGNSGGAGRLSAVCSASKRFESPGVTSATCGRRRQYACSLDRHECCSAGPIVAADLARLRPNMHTHCDSLAAAWRQCSLRKVTGETHSPRCRPPLLAPCAPSGARTGPRTPAPGSAPAQRMLPSGTARAQLGVLAHVAVVCSSSCACQGCQPAGVVWREHKRTTQRTSGTSRPRAATSVATSTPFGSFLKRSRACK
jgi:hypothetical protein